MNKNPNDKLHNSPMKPQESHRLADSLEVSEKDAIKKMKSQKPENTRNVADHFANQLSSKLRMHVTQQQRNNLVSQLQSYIRFDMGKL